MLLDQALAIVTAAGFRISKPKRPKALRPALNAVGKPYSPQYDPKYKINHKPRTSHLFWPYPDSMRLVGDPAPEAPMSRRALANKERKRKRAQADAPAWLLEADKLNQSAG